MIINNHKTTSSSTERIYTTSFYIRMTFLFNTLPASFAPGGGPLPMMKTATLVQRRGVFAGRLFCRPEPTQLRHRSGCQILAAAPGSLFRDSWVLLPICQELPPAPDLRQPWLSQAGVSRGVGSRKGRLGTHGAAMLQSEARPAARQRPLLLPSILIVGSCSFFVCAAYDDGVATVPGDRSFQLGRFSIHSQCPL
jgi:hypothetical protein